MAEYVKGAVSSDHTNCIPRPCALQFLKGKGDSSSIPNIDYTVCHR